MRWKSLKINDEIEIEEQVDEKRVYLGVYLLEYSLYDEIKIAAGG